MPSVPPAAKAAQARGEFASLKRCATQKRRATQKRALHKSVAPHKSVALRKEGRLQELRFGESAIYEKVGNFTRSSWGTRSTGCPALRHAPRPPAMTKTLNPK